jgi:hypothetical protein
MEAIEYLRGKENKELNDVIILIIKEFLGISEKEAIGKVKSVIQTGKVYCEFEKLVTNQKGNLKLFFEKYNEENSNDNGIELKAGFDRNNRKDRCIKSSKSSI